MILVRSIDLLVLTVPVLPKPTPIAIRLASPDSPESSSSLDMPVSPKICWAGCKIIFFDQFFTNQVECEAPTVTPL